MIFFLVPLNPFVFESSGFCSVVGAIVWLVLHKHSRLWQPSFSSPSIGLCRCLSVLGLLVVKQIWEYKCGEPKQTMR